jgi:DNA ligase 4
LKQMKIGSTEKTILYLWHPDAHSLFNTTSSLRRVCWALYNSSVRLEGEERGVTPMQCFQPQLAQFHTLPFKKIVEKMGMTEDDPTFWIEEKLDGERMQLHMVPDKDTVGGRKFGFWSRRAKNYAYLYGNGLRDKNGALTRYLGKAFYDGVESIILDGEMISWDPEQDAAIPFGYLKTAALNENRNPYAGTERPLFRVFDILYLNGHLLTPWTLRDRRNALEKSIIPVHRRFELHEYKVASSVEDVEPMLRDVVARGEEGLVLKNPRSSYGLNERNDNWMKIKPEYMKEFGESLDCLVIGGYYGSGRRGGILSSFLCGLRVDESHAKKGEYNPKKFWSFFKVGGGMTANDYATIRHTTEDKWHKWDSKNPPTEYIELGGGDLQFEKPDVWIKPEDSLVIEAKAASVGSSEQFRCGLTLRFPRFKKIRSDKDWQSALSMSELQEVKAKAEKEQNEKVMKVDESRRPSKKQKREYEVKVVGYGTKDIQQAKYRGETSTVFENMTFYIMTESIKPEKKTKIEMEEMVKAHGGKVVQSATAISKTFCVADRRTVKVASLEKRGDISILKSIWLFDCIKQSQRDLANGKPEVVVLEELERHFYFLASGQEYRYEDNVDGYGDSYGRDTSLEELKELLEKMGTVNKCSQSKMAVALKDIHNQAEDLPGWIFADTKIYFDQPVTAHTSIIGAGSHTPPSNTAIAATTAAFAGAVIANEKTDPDITHIVVDRHSDVKQLRRECSDRSKLPRIVTLDWIEESWKERTRIDEEKFRP